MTTSDTPDDALPADVDADLDDYLDEYVQSRTVELQNLIAARDVLLDTVADQISEQLDEGSLRPEEVQDLVPDWALDAVLERLSSLDVSETDTGDGQAWIDPAPWAPPWDDQADHGPDNRPGERADRGDDLDTGW